MGLFSLFLLSMRPAYNNPFNQAANPSARRQRAINNKATHLLIFVFGGGERRREGRRLFSILLFVQKNNRQHGMKMILYVCNSFFFLCNLIPVLCVSWSEKHF